MTDTTEFVSPEDGKELLLMASSQYEFKNYGAAAYYYEKLGKMHKARMSLKKQVVEGLSNGDFLGPARAFEKLGDPEAAKQCWKLAGEYFITVKNFYQASDCYEKAGIPEQAKKCRINDADEYIKSSVYAEEFNTRESYSKALKIYKTEGCSLSTLPKESQEKILRLVRKGNVEATQCLAELVKTEEEELIFNEARAGLVL